ncbi:primary-amine oxidase [Agromyces mediolanus]|uniref:Amine oxidase n=1 Tax=Agromyces mediolanus TaxID=41986 RepID=A0A918CG01_AGRME|nr:primary-amine oxidase [Agromyces mediolanus]GGR20502.1 amine oxidase [Agromyces mediolanus]GLJ73231.1 amine oxidase [Agromyces mediolanus]
MTRFPDHLPEALRTLQADEIAGNRAVLEREGLVTDDTHFSYVGLDEADKRELFAGGRPPRRVRSFLIDMATGRSHDTVVEPATGVLVSARELELDVDGAVPVVLREFSLVEEVVHRDERWLAAMAKRGLTDVSKLRVNPLSAGVLADTERGRRIQRCFTFVQHTPEDLGWAHPVDGVTVMVDVVTGEVLDVVDYAELPVPAEEGNYHLPEWRGPDREGLKPIEITQPEGPSFTIDEHGVLSWAGWQLQVGFDQREGLVLHNIGIDDDGETRPVIYRASIAEMVVPYGDPSPQRWFQNFFDGGEYLFGGFANSLELGCDCVGDITYLDAVVAGNDGAPHVIHQAICIHEEDAGILWKHSDNWNGSSETRRNRRLVVSFFMTVGNYDYGFYWYFGLDGTIEFEIKATGIVFTSSYPGEGYPWATEVAPGLGAPNHQHLFSARLDMMVDGHRNSVDEVEAVAVPRGADNPSGTGFTQSFTRLSSELQAQREADNRRGRVWLVTSEERRNRLGRPTGWVLFPEGGPLLLADADSDIAARAAYTTKHLWVTPYAPDERYPAGDFVNLHRGGAGLPEWTAGDRPVEASDLVLWHTFGLTHFPRVEDWPIMPVDSTGFVLKPHGFFGRNPSLDIPAAADHCAPDHHASAGHAHPHDAHH